MLNVRNLIVATILALLCHTSNAQEVERGRARLDQFLAELSTFSADFEQELFDEYGELLETASGQVAIAKPGRFRWEYEDPYAQLIVTDGATLWVYDVDLEQVSINPVAEQATGSPAALLVGDVDIDKHYVVSKGADEGSEVWVNLSPKNDDPQYAAIEIGFDAEQLIGMRLRDNLSQLTSIRFSEVERNVEIAAAKFDFVPPAGVDVMTNRAPGAEPVVSDGLQ